MNIVAILMYKECMSRMLIGDKSHNIYVKE